MIAYGSIKFWRHASFCIVKQDRPRTPDIFLHHRVARDSGLDPRLLTEGVPVRVEFEETERGLRATYVERI